MEGETEMEKTTSQNFIEIEQAESEQQSLESLANDLVENIRIFNESEDERYTILLPAGSAAEKLFIILQEKLKEVDLTKVHFVQAEQLWPIEKNHPASLLGGMEKTLIDVGVPENNIHLFDSQAEKESEAMEEVVTALDSGIDYALLGLNTSGAVAGIRDGEEFKTEHIDMVNLDLNSLTSRENLGMEDLPYKGMSELVKQMNEKFWPDDPASRPRKMLAPGWKYLLESRNLAILATGESKKEAIKVVVANMGTEIPIRTPDHQLVDVLITPPRDIEDQSRHLTSTGEIALSREKSHLKTKIYTDYSVK